MKKRRLFGKFTLEFLSVFVAVLSAFALSNWNDNRRDALAEQKILDEMANGLKADISDLEDNVQGHKTGIAACRYLRRAIDGKPFDGDSAAAYLYFVTRDYINLQNVSGYESLKSRGLELVGDDSLRLQIISLYEYGYKLLQKLEEDYSEIQFHTSYFHDINEILAPYYVFDDAGALVAINPPDGLTLTERNILKSYLLSIQSNRRFILYHYGEVEKRTRALLSAIETALGE